MRKYFSFLKEFVFTNLILFLLYVIFLLLSNIFLEGGLSQYSGALVDSGYDASDLSKTMIFVIRFLLMLINIGLFVGFYVISYFRLKRNTHVKKIFLKNIGSDKFDRKDFCKRYLSTDGRWMIIFFLITIATGAFFNALSIPFSTFLMISQINLIESIFTTLFENILIKKILVFLFTVCINILAYYIYQKFICVSVYDQWAKERLHVDAN